MSATHPGTHVVNSNSTRKGSLLKELDCLTEVAQPVLRELKASSTQTAHLAQRSLYEHAVNLKQPLSLIREHVLSNNDDIEAILSHRGACEALFQLTLAGFQLPVNEVVANFQVMYSGRQEPVTYCVGAASSILSRIIASARGYSPQSIAALAVLASKLMTQALGACSDQLTAAARLLASRLSSPSPSPSPAPSPPPPPPPSLPPQPEPPSLQHSPQRHGADGADSDKGNGDGSDGAHVARLAAVDMLLLQAADLQFSLFDVFNAFPTQQLARTYLSKLAPRLRDSGVLDRAAALLLLLRLDEGSEDIKRSSGFQLMGGGQAVAMLLNVCRKFTSVAETLEKRAEADRVCVAMPSEAVAAATPTAPTAAAAMAAAEAVPMAGAKAAAEAEAATAAARALREALAGAGTQHAVLLHAVAALCAADGGSGYGLGPEVLGRMEVLDSAGGVLRVDGQRIVLPPPPVQPQEQEDEDEEQLEVGAELDARSFFIALDVLSSDCRRHPPGDRAALSVMLRIARLGVTSAAAAEGGTAAAAAGLSAGFTRREEEESAAAGLGSGGGDVGLCGGGGSGTTGTGPASGASSLGTESAADAEPAAVAVPDSIQGGDAPATVADPGVTGGGEADPGGSPSGRPPGGRASWPGMRLLLPADAGLLVSGQALRGARRAFSGSPQVWARGAAKWWRLAVAAADLELRRDGGVEEQPVIVGDLAPALLRAKSQANHKEPSGQAPPLPPSATQQAPPLEFACALSAGLLPLLERSLPTVASPGQTPPIGDGAAACDGSGPAAAAAGDGQASPQQAGQAPPICWSSSSSSSSSSSRKLWALFDPEPLPDLLACADLRQAASLVTALGRTLRQIATTNTPGGAGAPLWWEALLQVVCFRILSRLGGDGTTSQQGADLVCGQGTERVRLLSHLVAAELLPPLAVMLRAKLMAAFAAAAARAAPAAPAAPPPAPPPPPPPPPSAPPAPVGSPASGRTSEQGALSWEILLCLLQTVASLAVACLQPAHSGGRDDSPEPGPGGALGPPGAGGALGPPNGTASGTGLGSGDGAASGVQGLPWSPAEADTTEAAARSSATAAAAAGDGTGPAARPAATATAATDNPAVEGWQRLVFEEAGFLDLAEIALHVTRVAAAVVDGREGGEAAGPADAIPLHDMVMTAVRALAVVAAAFPSAMRTALALRKTCGAHKTSAAVAAAASAPVSTPATSATSAPDSPPKTATANTTTTPAAAAPASIAQLLRCAAGVLRRLGGEPAAVSELADTLAAQVEDWEAGAGVEAAGCCEEFSSTRLRERLLYMVAAAGAAPGRGGGALLLLLSPEELRRRALQQGG